MEWRNKKFIVAGLIGGTFLIGLSAVVFFYNKGGAKKDSLAIDSAKDEVLVQVGDVYQKINISLGHISQADSLERGDFANLEGLPEKGDHDFYENITVINSDNPDKISLISFVGLEDNNDKQKEFICSILEKKCVPSDLFTTNYTIEGMDVIPSSMWWLGWNGKDNVAIGLTTNEANLGTLYVCDINNKICKINKSQGLNFPSGALNKSMNKVVAIGQNDIANEKIGEKWELFVYNLNNLAESIEKHDISSIISKDEDLIYDGVNSVVWGQDERHLFIGTTRGIFELNLDKGEIKTIFVDTQENEDDFYWNSDNFKLSQSGRYLIFVDTVEVGVNESEENLAEEDLSEDSENILMVIDLNDNNKVIELLQAENIVLN